MTYLKIANIRGSVKIKRFKSRIEIILYQHQNIAVIFTDFLTGLML